MKCPKCNYLGFETGDRCRNCGYDFSLLMPADLRAQDVPAVELDLPLRLDTGDRDLGHEPGRDLLLHRDSDALGAPAPSWEAAPPVRPAARSEMPPAAVPVPAVAASASSLSMTFSAEPPSTEPPAAASQGPAHVAPAMPPSPVGPGQAPALPLFGRDDGDAPLVSLPAAPRPPLAVRRTPVPPPRPRGARAPEPRDRDRFPELAIEPAAAAPEPSSPVARSPTAALLPEPRPSVPPVSPAPDHQARAPRVAMPVPPAAPAGAIGPGHPAPARGARLLAGAIDHGILLGVDAVVVYFTLRLTDLTPDAWRTLPLAPLVAFLVFVKLAYLGTFTAVGGQSIGKMAARLRVVTDDWKPVPFGRGLWRSAAALTSALPLGLGLAPMLLDGDGRAFHDRLAGTRVVPVPRP